MPDVTVRIPDEHLYAFQCALARRLSSALDGSSEAVWRAAEHPHQADDAHQAVKEIRACLEVLECVGWPGFSTEDSEISADRDWLCELVKKERSGAREVYVDARRRPETYTSEEHLRWSIDNSEASLALCDYLVEQIWSRQAVTV